MGKKSGPRPPDPAETAASQSKLNREAAFLSTGLNQINQVTPFGNVSFSGAIGGPDRTQTVTLSPGEQANLDARNALSASILGIGQAGAGNLPPLPGNTDFSGDASRVEQATFERLKGLLDPAFADRRRDFGNLINDRGLPLTGEASGRLLADLRRAENEGFTNAGLEAVGAGRAEQSRLFGLESASRGQAFSELAQILAGSGGNAPQANQLAAFGIAPPDIQNLISNNFKIQSENRSGALGGLFDLVGTVGGGLLGGGFGTSLGNKLFGQ